MTTTSKVTLKHKIAHKLNWNDKEKDVVIEGDRIYEVVKCATCGEQYSKKELRQSEEAEEYRGWRIVRVNREWVGLHSDGRATEGSMFLKVAKKKINLAEVIEARRKDE